MYIEYLPFTKNLLAQEVTQKPEAFLLLKIPLSPAG